MAPRPFRQLILLALAASVLAAGCVAPKLAASGSTTSAAETPQSAQQATPPIAFSNCFGAATLLPVEHNAAQHMLPEGLDPAAYSNWLQPAHWFGMSGDAGLLVLSVHCADAQGSATTTKHPIAFAVIGVPLVQPSNLLSVPLRLATLEVLAESPLREAFDAAGFLTKNGSANVTFTEHVPSGEVASPTAVSTEAWEPGVFAIEQTVVAAPNAALTGYDLKTVPIELVAIKDQHARGGATLKFIDCWCLEGTGDVTVMGGPPPPLVGDGVGIGNALGMLKATLAMHPNATAR